MKKGTTIYVPDELHEALTMLKMELKKSTYAAVIKQLLEDYRETHGWSVLSVAKELRKLDVK